MRLWPWRRRTPSILQRTWVYCPNCEQDMVANRCWAHTAPAPTDAYPNVVLEVFHCVCDTWSSWDFDIAPAPILVSVWTVDHEGVISYIMDAGTANNQEDEMESKEIVTTHTGYYLREAGRTQEQFMGPPETTVGKVDKDIARKHANREALAVEIADLELFRTFLAKSDHARYSDAARAAQRVSWETLSHSGGGVAAVPWEDLSPAVQSQWIQVVKAAIEAYQ